jgi:large subunit ribosomal protein L25
MPSQTTLQQFSRQAKLHKTALATLKNFREPYATKHNQLTAFKVATRKANNNGSTSVASATTTIASTIAPTSATATGTDVPAAVKPTGPQLGSFANPFLPTKVNGKWRAPKYSLRRQKELVKAARVLGGAMDLLPPGPKMPDPVAAAAAAKAASALSVTQAKANTNTNATTKVVGRDVYSEAWAKAKVVWTTEIRDVPVAKDRSLGHGAARVYTGRKIKFKGHKWERTLRRTTYHRHVLMRDMEQRISKYKSVSVWMFRVLVLNWLTMYGNSTTRRGNPIPSSRSRLSRCPSCRSELVVVIYCLCTHAHWHNDFFLLLHDVASQVQYGGRATSIAFSITASI